MIRRWRIHPLWLLNWPLPGRIQGDDDLAREPNFFNQRRLHLAMDSSWIGDVCASEIAEFFTDADAYFCDDFLPRPRLSLSSAGSKAW